MTIIHDDPCGGVVPPGGMSLSRRSALMGGVAIAAGRLAAATGIGGALAALGGAAPALSAGARPNIVYIIADDIGFADLGYRGSDIKTPNIDKLAAEGARLDHFYTQPMCTPTRAALMTGRYPLRYGLQIGVIPAAGSYGIPGDEYMLPEALKDAGYTTAAAGKWHIGHGDTAMWPRQRGFDSFYGALVGEIDHYEHASHGVKDWYRDNAPLDEEGYDTELFTAEGVRVINAHDGSAPLFLYMAYTSPHTPFQAPQKYVDRYPDIADPQRQLYAAMISSLDDGVGALVAALEARGLRENTLIIFHSDNGGTRSKLFAGDSPVAGELPASNAPLRDGKGTVYEGGTRVGAVANWPGKIQAGDVTGVVHVTDMLPTLVALAGGTVEKSKPLDGVDAWATMSAGAPTARAEMVYNVDPMIGAVRRGDWKLVWTAALPGHIELFDLAADESEANNLAAANPDKVAELQARVVELAREMAPSALFADAIRLTFGAPPRAADPSSLFNEGD